MSEAERWRRVKEIFDSAVSCRIEDRPALVRDLCGDDRVLRGEVESLLAADAGHGSVFEHLVGRAIRGPVFDAVAGALNDPTQALMPGDHLGTYEITGLLGAGGMGQVYRARDTALGRDVAVKILPDLWLADPDRRARFDREARLLASLNHPNIGAIYGVHESDASTRGGLAVKALVLELVEGETLADRIARQERPAGATGSGLHVGEAGPGLPIDEVMSIARQVIEALEAAHERGIVHRDLKPANIKITPEGRVKVLDFGLARAMGGTAAGGPQLANSPAVAVCDTQDGVLLGTAPYMSPEQARGRLADKRTDIWAFGCVVYEMLTGAPALAGDGVAEVLANVIKSEPDWSALPVDTPTALRLSLRRCLQKDLRQRFHDIADVRLALEGALELPSGDGTGERGRPSYTSLAYAGWAIALVAIAALASGWFSAGRVPAASAQVTRLLVGVTPADQLGGVEGRPTRAALALSRDGRTLVFSALRANRRALYVRQFDQADATMIPGTEGAISPFFSPNGKWVGFFVAGEIRKLPLAGGPSVHVADTGLVLGPLGASWGDDDRIVFARRPGALWEVAASGGAPTEIITPDQSRGEVSYRLPHVLPGGDAILFTVTHHRFPRWDQTQIRVYSRRTRLTRPLINGGADARYVSSGHLVYAREGVLLAARFDLQRLEVRGGPVGVVADVMQAAYAREGMSDTGVAQFTAASTGTLVYLPGGVFAPAERSVVRVDRTGRSETLPIPPRAFATLRLSPDGRQIALNTFGRDRDIWLYSLAREMLTRMSLPGRLNVPIWSRDGHWITYASSTAGADKLYRVRADGGGLPEQLIASEHNLVPGTWTAAGALLYYPGPSAFLSGRQETLFSQNGALKGIPAPVWSQNRGGVDVSPDGRWIAYHSDDSGQLQVYVQAHPGPGPRYQVSTDGGMSPIWRADGRELFYARQRVGTPPQETLDVQMMAVGVTTQPALTFGKPGALFEGPYQMNQPARGYDVTADGQRFLLIQARERPPDVITQMIVVQNWFEELKRLAP